MASAATLRDLTLPTFDVRRVARLVRDYGAAVIPDFASADELSGLREEFHQLLDDRNPGYIYPINYAPGRAVSAMRAKMPAGLYPALNRFFERPELRGLTDRYVGHPCMFNYEIYATHEFKPETDIAPTHFDKLWTLKFMLYLADVGPANGPFGVFPGSGHIARKRFRDIFETHNLKHLSIRDPRFQKMGNSDVPSDLGPVIDITGKAGTMIVFDTDTFHHAGYVQPGHERMIMRGHNGPEIQYSKVRRKSRQWWRGEKRYSRLHAAFDNLIERWDPAPANQK
jgi:hypothetical protein